MRNTRLALLLGIILLFVAVPLSATPAPVPLFDECPKTGHAVGCSYLVVFGTHGSVDIHFDQNVKDVDGQENILVGIRNNSGHYISLSGYNGPNNVFSGLHLTGGLWDGEHTYFKMKEESEPEDGGEECDDDDDCKVGVTPEPSSMALLGTGLLAMGGILRRRLRP